MSVRTYGDVITKFSRMDTLPFSLKYGAHRSSARGGSVISLFLKIRQSAASFMSLGSLFQQEDPQKAKDRCPVFNLHLGRFRSFLYRVFLSGWACVRVNF